MVQTMGLLLGYERESKLSFVPLLRCGGKPNVFSAVDRFIEIIYLYVCIIPRKRRTDLLLFYRLLVNAKYLVDI
jgi:hypothetical protein